MFCSDPKSPGEEFDRFCGPSWSETGADMLGEAVKWISSTLVVVEEGERRSKRDRTASASREVGASL